ncbi:MAG: glycosyltransferase family 2 protein [Acidobacteriota bacterium]
MKTAVVVVAHAGFHNLEDSLSSLTAYADRSDVEVILVDNGSADRCGDAALGRWPWITVVRAEKNLGFAGGVHLGVEASGADILVFLNDDAAAGKDLIDAHLETLGSNPQAAASAGRLTNWDGDRHDFIRGGVTFDCHAFQLGQGFELTEIEPPAPGEFLPFACGGNMAIRREDWDSSGGFDPKLFAYFEDVDLGWRLWARGREVVAAPEAVARHRGAATSAGLGDFKRGVLFERNALRTFFVCADDEYRGAFGEAVWATYLHRLTAYVKADLGIAPQAADPFGNGLQPMSRGERWHGRIRENGIIGAVRHALARVLLGPKVGAPSLKDGHLLMQLRAASGFFSNLDDAGGRRREIQEARVVPDREIVARFPRLVVPTYPGDDEWFGSEVFREMLPVGWRLQHLRLDEILHT